MDTHIAAIAKYHLIILLRIGLSADVTNNILIVLDTITLQLINSLLETLIRLQLKVLDEPLKIEPSNALNTSHIELYVNSAQPGHIHLVAVVFTNRPVDSVAIYSGWRWIHRIIVRCDSQSGRRVAREAVCDVCFVDRRPVVFIVRRTQILPRHWDFNTVFSITRFNSY